MKTHLVVLVWMGFGSSFPILAGEPFAIEVVDSQTGRGVPLVELKTVNEIKYVTDSRGIVALSGDRLGDLSR